MPPGWPHGPAAQSTSQKCPQGPVAGALAGRPRIPPPLCQPLGASDRPEGGGPAHPLARTPLWEPTEGTELVDSWARPLPRAPPSCRALRALASVTAGLLQQCSGQHDVTGQGDEFPVGLWGGSRVGHSFLKPHPGSAPPPPPPLPLPAGPGAGFGAGSAPRAVFCVLRGSSSPRQARARLHSERAFSEAPALLCAGLLACWPAVGRAGGGRYRRSHTGEALEDPDSCR